MSLLYILDDRSRVFAYDMAKNEANYLFHAYGDDGWTPGALCVLQDVSGTTPALYFYVLKNQSGLCQVSVYNSSGLRFTVSQFNVSSATTGLSLWPDNQNLLAAHSGSSVAILNMNGQTTEIPTPYAYVKGMASLGLDPNDATGQSGLFAIPVGDDYPRRINVLRINRTTGRYDIRPSGIPPNSIDRGCLMLALAGADVSSGIYSLHDGENGKNLVLQSFSGSQNVGTVMVNVVGGNVPFVVSPFVPFVVNGTIVVNTRKYDVVGNFLGDASGLDFGLMAPGGSSTMVFDMAVAGVKTLKSVKLGLIGTVPDGVGLDCFKVDVVGTLPYTSVPAGTFAGISDGGMDSGYNWNVGVKAGGNSKNESNYVVLQVNVPAGHLGNFAGRFKWMFEFE